MDQNFSNLISLRIKSALKEAKMSQTELSSLLHKSKAYVSNITKGRYVPKINELLRIAELLRKPVGYFFGEDTPGLVHYVDKAKKWEKLVSMIDKEIKTELENDILSVPIIDISLVKGKNRMELVDLRNQTKDFIFLSKNYIRKFIKYYNNPDNLFSMKVFIRDYPEFGIKIGDILVFEIMESNEINDDSGKLFGTIYKNEIGLKRIYKDKNEYYFEPMHSTPQIDKISYKDPNLLIPGKVVFTISHKIF